MSLGELEDGFLENPYFSRSEFACKCGCGGNTVDARLLELLTTFRGYFDKPIIITSGYRCENWNRKQNGSPKSQHLVGKAADFYVKGEDIEVVYSIVNDAMADWGGVGLYDSWIHLDVRPTKARW